MLFLPRNTQIILLTFSLVIRRPAAGQDANSMIQIVQEPSSLIIPVGETGTFHCTASCLHECQGRWRINGTLLADADSRGMHSEFRPGNVSYGYTLILTVHASIMLNNTSVSCRYQSVGDPERHEDLRSTAFLFVVSHLSIPSNPFLVVKGTHLILEWSPAFLWPGHRIQEYNVFYARDYGTNVSHYNVNSSYVQEIVSLTLPFFSDALLSCINFNISAVDGITSEYLPPAIVSNWVWKFSSSNEFTLSFIDASVLFKVDGKPVALEVHIQLPTSSFNCSKLNYTMIIEDESDKVVSIHTLPADSKYGFVNETINVVNFEKNRRYFLRIETEVYAVKLTSSKYSFDTCLLNHIDGSCNTEITQTVSPSTTTWTVNMNPYFILTIIFGSLVVLLLLSVVALTVCLFTHYRRRKTNDLSRNLSESRNRVGNAMVTNPIYVDGDCPLYDSVDPQSLHWKDIDGNIPQLLPDSRYTNFQQSAVGASFHEYSELKTADCTDQHSASHLQNKSASTIGRSQSVAESDYITPTSQRYTQSNAVEPKRATSLKKSGKERNKLHLTLRLSENDKTNCESSFAGVLKQSDIKTECEVGGDIDEETYTVMNPIGSVHRHRMNTIK